MDGGPRRPALVHRDVSGSDGGEKWEANKKCPGCVHDLDDQRDRLGRHRLRGAARHQQPRHAETDLMVSNCSVGPDDKNLWYYRLEFTTGNIELCDSANLKVNPSASQVVNFCTI
jgi:hypothetical protein